MELKNITDLQMYHDVVGGARYAVFNFCDHRNGGGIVDLVFNDLASYAYSDTVAFYEVEIDNYKDIIEHAKVDHPTLILYKNGKEVERYANPRPQQLEYLVSRALCGLTEITGGLSES